MRTFISYIFWYLLLGLSLAVAQPPWQPVNTGDDHTIVILSGASLNLDGSAIPSGTFIGVFYLDQAGVEQCGGYVEWLGSSTTLAAFGDDATTPAKDGFAAGEAFRFRLYQPNGCEIAAPQINFAPLGPVYVNQGNYATNGISGLDSLFATSLAIQVTASPDSCGLTVGAVSVSISGGLAPYDILWSTGDTTATVSNLTGGTYSVTVSDAGGCSQSGNASVGASTTLPPQAIFSYVVDTLARVVTFTDASTGPPGLWHWDYGDGNTSHVPSPSHYYAQADSYVVCLSVKNSCGVDTSCKKIAVGNPCAPDWVVTHTGDDHTIIIPPNASILLNGQAAPVGTYIGAFFLDGNGHEKCGGYGQLTQGATSFPIFGDDNLTTVKDGFAIGEQIIWRFYEPCGCEYLADSVSFLPIGGLISHQGDFAANGISGLNVLSTDSLNIQLQSTPATCGQNNGIASVTAMGGLPPYQYLWSTGDTVDMISGLGPGIYVVKVTDASGCWEVTDSITVIFPPLPVVDITAPDSVICPNDSMLLSAIGGNFASYSWNTGDTTANIYIYSPGTYIVTVVDSFGCVDTDSITIKICGVLISPKVFLTGPYDTRSRLMRDSLRIKNLIPKIEPYTALGFTQVGNTGNDSVSQAVLAITGADAIVDWIFMELRSKNDSSLVLATRSVLLQRDGDIVDTDGFSPVNFSGIIPDDFYVAVRHRNHLGAMTAKPINLLSLGSVDFTAQSLATHGNCARRNLGNVMTLWSGDANGDGSVVYVGAGSDVNPISIYVFGNCGNFVPCPGYDRADLDLSGNVVYISSNPGFVTDITWISTTVINYPCNVPAGISIPVFEQIP